MEIENNLSSLLAGLGILAILVVIIVIGFLVLYIVARWKLYKKAGKNGWEAIVPFYNDYVYVEIAGLNWWWFLLVIAITICTTFNLSGGISTIADLASLFGLFVCNYNLAKKFHKTTGFAVLMTIFPFIVIPVIGLSNNYVFDNNVPVSKNGPFDSDNKDNNLKEETTNTKNTNSFCKYCGNKLEENQKFCTSCGKENN